MNSNEDIIRYFYEHIVSDNLLGNLEDFVSEDCTVWADGNLKTSYQKTVRYGQMVNLRRSV